MISKENISIVPANERIREADNARRMLATVVLATAVGLAGLGAFEVLSKNDKNAALPVPTEFVPKPISVDTRTPIEEIPLQTEGSITVSYNANGDYSLQVENATVVAIKKNEAGDITQFAVTVAGNKLSKDCANQDAGKVCNFSGATLWISPGKDTAVLNASDAALGLGNPQEILRSLSIGNVVRSIGVGPGYLEGSTLSGSKVVTENLHSLNNLSKKVGKPFLRTDLSASFVPGNISI